MVRENGEDGVRAFDRVFNDAPSIGDADNTASLACNTKLSFRPPRGRGRAQYAGYRSSSAWLTKIAIMHTASHKGRSISLQTLAYVV